MKFTISNIKLSRTQWVDFVIIPLVIFITWYLIFLTSGLLTSGFRLFINDHIMVGMSQDVKEIGFFSTVQKWLLIDRTFGRFQPFYYTQAIILTMLLGINATVWFSYASVLTSLMSYFLFLFARFLELPVIISLIFPYLAFLGPQAITWAQPSQPQLIGTFLLSAALFLAGVTARVDHRKVIFDITFVVLVLMMSLSKETYIIFIPALLFIKVWLYQRIKRLSLRQAVFHNRMVIAALFLIVCLELGYIIFGISIRGMGYAGLDDNTLQIFKVLSATITLLQTGHFKLFVLSFVLALIVTLWKRQSLIELINQLFLIFIIFLLIVIPQIVIYTKSGFYGVYFIPATIGTALLISYTIFLLGSRSKILSGFVLGLAIFIICIEVSLAWNSYNQMAKDSKIINNLFESISYCTQNNEPILVAGNPRIRFEGYIATKATLNSMFQRNNLLTATYGIEKTDFFSNTFEESEKSLLFLDPVAITKHYGNKSILDFSDKSKIKAVVVFDNLDDDFLKTSLDWFNPEDYMRTEYSTTIVSARLYCKK